MPRILNTMLTFIKKKRNWFASLMILLLLTFVLNNWYCYEQSSASKSLETKNNEEKNSTTIADAPDWPFNKSKNLSNESKSVEVKNLIIGKHLVIEYLVKSRNLLSQEIKVNNLINELTDWPINKSRNLNIYIEPNKTTTIISPIDKCKSSIYFYIIVTSKVDNQEQRNAIRKTWANKQTLNGYQKNVTVNFIIGKDKNNTLNNLIKNEADKYQDIIQESFVDSYNNLTIKSSMMLKWIVNNCSNVKYIMKTDDDMFVNVKNILNFLIIRNTSDGLLLGSVLSKSYPFRQPNSKWYMPTYMYSGNRYPPFLSGTAYIMSLDVAVKIYNTALSTPLLYLEDVYLTGICANKIGIKLENHKKFGIVPIKKNTKLYPKTIFTIHGVKPELMMNIWKYNFQNNFKLIN